MNYICIQFSSFEETQNLLNKIEYGQYEIIIFNKNKVIDDEVISFFESAGFFYNPKTDKFEQTNSVQK